MLVNLKTRPEMKKASEETRKEENLIKDKMLTSFYSDSFGESIFLLARRYELISDSVQRFLRPNLNGLGKEGLDFIHLSIVFLPHLQILATSSKVKSFESVSSIKSLYYAICAIISQKAIATIKKIMRHYGILWVDNNFNLEYSRI